MSDLWNAIQSHLFSVWGLIAVFVIIVIVVSIIDRHEHKHDGSDSTDDKRTPPE